MTQRRDFQEGDAVVVTSIKEPGHIRRISLTPSGTTLYGVVLEDRSSRYVRASRRKGDADVWCEARSLSYRDSEVTFG